MPVVSIHMLVGRTVDQKRRLAAEITRAMVEIAGADRQNVHVYIDEVAPDSWARAGVLIADDTPKTGSEVRGAGV
jgi:4-oxalocrotonate tautomerase